jgi:hypothetical protein
MYYYRHDWIQDSFKPGKQPVCATPILLRETYSETYSTSGYVSRNSIEEFSTSANHLKHAYPAAIWKFERCLTCEVYVLPLL